MLPEWRKEMQSRRKLEGIDVSHWEGRIDFFEVRRAGIRIVYIKASEEIPTSSAITAKHRQRD